MVIDVRSAAGWRRLVGPLHEVLLSFRPVRWLEYVGESRHLLVGLLWRRFIALCYLLPLNLYAKQIRFLLLFDARVILLLNFIEVVDSVVCVRGWALHADNLPHWLLVLGCIQWVFVLLLVSHRGRPLIDSQVTESVVDTLLALIGHSRLDCWEWSFVAVWAFRRQAFPEWRHVWTCARRVIILFDHKTLFGLALWSQKLRRLVIGWLWGLSPESQVAFHILKSDFVHIVSLLGHFKVRWGRHFCRLIGPLSHWSMPIIQLWRGLLTPAWRGILWVLAGS